MHCHLQFFSILFSSFCMPSCELAYYYIICLEQKRWIVIDIIQAKITEYLNAFIILFSSGFEASCNILLLINLAFLCSIFFLVKISKHDNCPPVHYLCLAVASSVNRLSGIWNRSVSGMKETGVKIPFALLCFAPWISILQFACLLYSVSRAAVSRYKVTIRYQVK